MGIDPQNLGSFTINMGKVRFEKKMFTDAEIREEEARLIENDTHQQNLWNARKVDEDSFVKDGIMQAVGSVVYVCY